MFTIALLYTRTYYNRTSRKWRYLGISCATCPWQVIGQDRFYHTGDLGVMDANGNLRIVGRLKDLIVRGGSKVFPAEVEQVHYKLQSINF